MRFSAWANGICLLTLLLGCRGSSSTSNQTITQVLGPQITTQPVAQTVSLGSPATFQVVVSGSYPLSYQWFKAGTPIPGATDATCTLAPSTKADHGAAMTVIASNAAGTVTSAPATLSVQWAPTLQTQPGDQVVTEGQAVTFQVVAEANPAPSYQWQKNGQAIPGATSEVYTIPATPLTDGGATFNVLVSNALGSLTSQAATLTVYAASGAPSILAQPQGLTQAQGATATLKVVAVGSGALSYQWTRNGILLPGATAAVLALAKVQPSDEAGYACVVTNTYRGVAVSTTSDAAVLVVNPPPIITTQPLSHTLPKGAPVSFTVAATGIGTLSYQWIKNGANHSGATSATFSLPSLEVSDGGIYACVVTNTLNGVPASTTSASAVLTISQPPTIVVQPQSQTLALGGVASFKVTASGTGTLTYQWTKNGVNLPGATAATLALTNVQVANAGAYACLITNTSATGMGTLMSASATLTINEPPTVTTQPMNQTVAQGDPVSFSVVATGSGTLSYQWRRGANTVIGATQATLAIASAQAMDAGVYACVVTNTLNGNLVSATSSNATLTVNLPPTFKTQPASQTLILGSPATFAVVATGSGVLTYQWRRDGVDLIGAASAQLTVPAVQASDAGIYTCLVTNTQNGTVAAASSAGAVLTLNLPPNITVQPLSLTSVQGTATTLSVVATGSGGLTYQWLKNGALVSGATSANLTFAATQPAHAGSYTCQVTNTLNYTKTSTTSATAVLVVNVPPVITTQPQSQSPVQASTATLTVTATGSAALSYQWTKEGVDLAGATSGTLSLLNVQGTDTGTYACVVTNTLGGTRASTTSLGATLTVQVPPSNPVVALQPFLTTGKTGLQASIVNQGSYNTYTWTLSSGTVTAGQGTSTITFTAGPPGVLTAAVTIANITGWAYGSAACTVVGTPTAELFYPPSVHPGDAWMAASVQPQPGMTYLWSLAPGTSSGALSSGQGSEAIGFSAGTALGTFQVQTNIQNLAGDSGLEAKPIKVERGTWLVKNGGALTAAQGATATLLPSGRVLVAGGQGTSPFAGYLAVAGLYDPTTRRWSPTAGTMGVARKGHSATLLSNGMVLVVGGSNSSGVLGSAELYNPATGTWAATGSLGGPRENHTATSLPNGTVLVAGGADAAGALASAELYDPATKTWTATTGSLAAARFGHTATLLQNGTVLVVGGHAAGPGAFSSAELYNPATKTWSLGTGALGTPRYHHTAIRLSDGTVLVAGGADGAGYPVTCERYDPQTQVWTPTTGGLAVGRERHTATLLPDGTVLVAGGSASSAFHNSSETYDPASQSWSSTSSPLGTARRAHSATLLADGTVLVVGGSNPSGILGSSEFYSPVSRLWAPTAADLGSARFQHTATLLTDGQVLAAGGSDGSKVHAGSVLYDSALRIWTATGSLVTARNRHTAALLTDGKVLLAGGQDASGMPLGSAERYDPAAKAWTSSGALHVGRYDHVGLLLKDGTVLVTGGDGGSGLLNTAEVFVPTTQTWALTTGSMSVARRGHTATLLADGTVLVAGGRDVANAPHGSVEIYHPATQTWTLTGSLAMPRYNHTATLLLDGTVLVAGGNDANGDPLASVEVFTPGTGMWATASSGLGAARADHTATLLPGGSVLVVGGFGVAWCLSSSELYNPISKTWAPTPTGLWTARHQHSTVLLKDGTVLVAFGQDGDTVTEVFLP